MEQTTYQVHVSQDDDNSLYATIEELPGLFASGADLVELEEALREAVEMYLSSANVVVKVTGLSLTQDRLVDDDHVPACVELALA